MTTHTYTIKGTLQTDMEIRQAKTANGLKPYAYGKIQGRNGKVHTILTMAAAAIALLNGAKQGQELELYGVFNPVKDAEGKVTGRTFAALGKNTRQAPATA